MPRLTRAIINIVESDGKNVYTSCNKKAKSQAILVIKEICHVSEKPLSVAADLRRILHKMEHLSEKLEKIPVPLADSLAGTIFSKDHPLIVDNVNNDIRHNDSIDVQINFHTNSLLGVPVRIDDRRVGVLEALNKKDGTFTEEDMKILTAIASQAAVAIENAQLMEALQESYRSTLEGWAAALDLRDRYTEDHSQHVTLLTVRLAQEVGMSGENLNYIRQGALLHDIGKMGVPDRILHKHGPLTEPEKEIMHRHPVNAYNMLYPIAYLRPALDIPYCNHEKWDGSGYPRSLKGEEIPLAARIFTIIDVWDAPRSLLPESVVEKEVGCLHPGAGWNNL